MPVTVRWILAASMPYLGAFGDDRGKSSEVLQAQDQAISVQRQSVTLMQASIEKQRESLQKHLITGSAVGFFILPPPTGQPAAFSPAAGDCDRIPVSQLEPLIANAAKRWGLEPNLLRSVMKQESGFQPCAISPKGAMGLMQVMPATAFQFNLSNPFDPVQNVDAGARLLKQLLDRYNGNLPLALGAYNAGPARVDEAGGVPHIPETTGYIEKVLSGWLEGPVQPK